MTLHSLQKTAAKAVCAAPRERGKSNKAVGAVIGAMPDDYAGCVIWKEAVDASDLGHVEDNQRFIADGFVVLF